MSAPKLHHVAFACRNSDATHHFYEELYGFPLVATEVQAIPGGGVLKHTFYDLGDGSCIAFFELPGVEGNPAARTAISTDLGLPVWVNHLAIRATPEKVEEVRARLVAEGLEPTMELDHDWCRSMYVTDPNGILIELCVDTPGLHVDPAEARRLREDRSGEVNVVRSH